jgi:hypothetical protein
MGGDDAITKKEAGNFSPASGLPGQPTPDRYPERLLNFLIDQFNRLIKK